MRVLHIVKTSDGAAWAAKQVRVLCSLGVEVHVALPRLEGRGMGYWQASGAALHKAKLDFPIRLPWTWPDVLTRAKRLVEEVEPDLLHSHFVGNTLVLRRALGKDHQIPRIYQVAGPLHLEHMLYRHLEIRSAGRSDYWIGSSRCVMEHYLRFGIHPSRVFLSYYGDDLQAFAKKGAVTVRHLACARREDFVVGNISWMYPPKRYLGQRVGLKAHEDIITALGIVLRKNPRALGVFAGGAWGGAEWYEHRLRKRAYAVAGDRIRFLGELPYPVAHDAWRGFDLAVHVPISENCGGVVEPLLAKVPVIASSIGGLPEVVVQKQTGWLVPARDPRALAEAIMRAMTNPLSGQEMAARGGELVRTMFDVNRTAREIFDIYRLVLGQTDRAPAPFDSRRFLTTARLRTQNVPRESMALIETD